MRLTFPLQTGRRSSRRRADRPLRSLISLQQSPARQEFAPLGVASGHLFDSTPRRPPDRQRAGASAAPTSQRGQQRTFPCNGCAASRPDRSSSLPSSCRRDRVNGAADLIRATPGRSFPDIAGDIGGSQTYVYDPATQTGTFSLSNAPHLISLGPSGKDLIPIQPDNDGTLYQTLSLKLDHNGRLIDSPHNRFRIWGKVVINDRKYDEILIEGRPIAFGIADRDGPGSRMQEVFGLNIQIEGGKLAGAFGPEAYLRIVPQEKCTFRGEFTRDFSGEKPMTNLIAVGRGPSALAIGPAAMMLAIAGSLAALTWWVARRTSRRWAVARRRVIAPWAASTW